MTDAQQSLWLFEFVRVGLECMRSQHHSLQALKVTVAEQSLAAVFESVGVSANMLPSIPGLLIARDARHYVIIWPLPANIQGWSVSS